MTQTNKKRLGLTVPTELHRKLKEKADYHGKTINSLCLDIFWEYFEPNTSEQPDNHKQLKRT